MLSIKLVDEVYWAHYIAIEKEFARTFEYVSLSTDNYNVYSEAYLKLILQIGSELDIVLKEYCELFSQSFSGRNLNDCRKIIKKNDELFCEQKVKVFKFNECIIPWEIWGKSENNPVWWRVYNKVKHERTKVGTIENETKEYYKFANLKNTLYLLAALYQTNVYLYYKVAEEIGERIKTPLLVSGIFQLVEGKWDEIPFYKPIVVWEDGEGTLYSESVDIHY